MLPKQPDDCISLDGTEDPLEISFPFARHRAQKQFPRRHITQKNQTEP